MAFDSATRNYRNKKDQQASEPNHLGVKRGPKYSGVITEEGIDASQYVTDTVLVGGRAVPGKEAENMRRYGFENPLDQYKYSTSETRHISEIWGIPQHLLDNWVKRGNLKEAREAHLESVRREMMYSHENLGAAREAHMRNRCETADASVKIIMEALESRMEDRSTAAGIVPGAKMSAGSIKALTEALVKAQDMKSIALMQPTKLNAQFSHTTREEVPIGSSTHRPEGAPSGDDFPDFDPEPPLSLPAHGQTTPVQAADDVIDAEVTE